MSDLGSDGDLLSGQILFGGHQVPIAFTQRSTAKPEADAQIGDPFKEVIPTNKSNSEVKDYSGVDLIGYHVGPIDITGDIDGLPNVLTGLTVVYNKGGGDQAFIEAATASGSGSSFSVGASVSGTATANAYCVPKLLPTIVTPATRNVPLKTYYFATQTFTTASFLTILTAAFGSTVLAWPVFKPVPLYFNLLGTKTSASARADYQGSFSISGSGTSLLQSDGVGKGLDVSPNIEQQEISPTIHGAFSLSGSDSQAHSATTALSVSGGIISGGGAGSNTATANGSISPTSVTATVPAALPTSGLYLYKIIFEASPAYGWYFIQAIVFDFASIA